MAKRFRRKTFRRRKRYSGSKRSSRRRTGSMSKRSMVVVKNPTLYPDTYRVKLRYDTRVSETALIFEERLYSGNSAYDPDVTFAGLQPAGFLLYSQMYQRYRVLGSSFRLQFCNTNSSVPTIVGVYPSPSIVTGIVDLDDAMAQPYGKYSLMGVASGTSRSQYIKSYLSTKKVFGLKTINESASYEGLTGPFGTGSDPPNEWAWSLYYGSADGISNPTLMGIISVTYYVEFYDRFPQLVA